MNSGREFGADNVAMHSNPCRTKAHVSMSVDTMPKRKGDRRQGSYRRKIGKAVSKEVKLLTKSWPVF